MGDYFSGGYFPPGYFPPGYFPGDGTTPPGTGGPAVDTGNYSSFLWVSSDGESLQVENYNQAGFLVHSLEGVSSPPGDVVTQQAPFQDGTTSVRSQLQGRSIFFELECIGSTRAELEAKKKAVGRLFSARNKVGGKNLGRLALTLSDLTMYQIYAVPVHVDDSGSGRGPNWQGFSIELYAEDPFFLGATNSAQLIDGSGVIFPITFPLSLIGGDILITVGGDVPVYPTIQIDGSVTNPTIYNLTTEKYIKVNTVIPTGQRLEIDHRFGKKTVKFISLSDATESNQFDKLESGSEFWFLPVGENHLRFTKDSGANTGIVTWVNRYQAVAA
jgi:hypothetical protein